MREPLINLSVALLALGLMAPASLWADPSAGGDVEFAQLLSEARAAQEKADDVGGEWRDVGKYLQEAEQAAASGDLAKARKLAQKARHQSEIGYEQAVAQQGKAGHPSYLK